MIRKLRLRNGITQQQLADDLRVSMQTISRWENAVTYPDIIMLPILARYFRVSVDYLLNTGGKMMQTIKSDRLLIRTWQENDVQTFWDLKVKEPDFVHYIKLSTLDEAQACIDVWKEYEELYPLVLQQSNTLIGVVGLVDVNRYKGYKELEVHLCQGYSDMAYTTEAHRLILDYGFNQSDLLVAFSLCRPEEDDLKEVLESVGFTYEGTLRKFGRDMTDRLRYSIVKEAYQM